MEQAGQLLVPVCSPATSAICMLHAALCCMASLAAQNSNAQGREGLICMCITGWQDHYIKIKLNFKECSAQYCEVSCQKGAASGIVPPGAREERLALQPLTATPILKPLSVAAGRVLPRWLLVKMAVASSPHCAWILALPPAGKGEEAAGML
jgi:hypothetical protein